MNITQLIGKQVFSIYEGQNIGTISQVILNSNNTKLKAVKFFDNEENEYIVLYNNIFAVSDNVLIKNTSKCNEVLDSQYINSPLLKNAISNKGENLGKIIDAEIDENSNIINYITDLHISINPTNILLTNNFVLVCNGQVHISAFKPKTTKITAQKNTESIKVKILQLEPKPKNLETPKKITYNPLSLIGKKAKSTLLGQNNEVIVKVDQVITDKIINDAKKHSRLNQLYFVANG